MTDNAAAEPDLAFLRELIEGTRSNRTQHLLGEAFLVGGGLYAFQCLSTYAMILFTPSAPVPVWLANASLPTVIFLAYCVWVNIRQRQNRGGSTTSRAINAVFQAGGFTNLVFICIFAPAAAMREDFTIWLFYPAVVFALQGAGWLTAYMLRRRFWLFGVAIGWFVSAIALGFLIGTATYLIVCGLGLALFMAVPGYVLMRLARKQG